jgi:hypothetical protein
MLCQLGISVTAGPEISDEDGGLASYRTASVMPTGRLFEAIGRRLCLLQDGIGYAYRTPL